LGAEGGVVVVARHIYANEGVRAFYKGLLPALLRAFPSTASLLATYEYVSSFLNKKMSSEKK